MGKHTIRGAGAKMASLPPSRTFRITEIKLMAGRPLGPQMKWARLYYGYNYRQMGAITGWNLSNVAHFENADNNHGQALSTATIYAKALGIKRITFHL